MVLQQNSLDGTILIAGAGIELSEKGFVWIDTKEDKQGFAIVSYFFNSKFSTQRHIVIHSDDFGSRKSFQINFGRL